MRKYWRMSVFTLLSLSLSLSAAERPGTAGSGGVVAEPQTKCEDGLIYVQFKGVDGWFQTTRKCSEPNVLPKLNATRASGSFSQPQIEVTNVDNSEACSQGYVGVTSKTRARRCMRIVFTPPDNPPTTDLFVACPYPQKFSSCHGSGNWGCGSENGVRGCWTQ